MTVAVRPLARGLVAVIALGIVVGVTPEAARLMGLLVDVPARLEIIDHVVPGAAAVMAGLLGLTAARRRNQFGVAAALAVGVLAGIWTTSTHVALVAQAAEGIVTWPAALFHTVPGLALLGTAAWFLVPLLRERP